MKGENIMSEQNISKDNAKRHKRTWQTRFMAALSLSLMASSCPLSALCLISNTPAATDKSTAEAAVEPVASVSAESSKQATEVSLKGQIYAKGLGLTVADLHLVNQGRFADLADKLAPKIKYDKPDRNAAWLAFAYLYLQKCDELNKLLNAFGVTKATDEIKPGADINLTLMQAFACLCDKKTDIAEKQLKSIPGAGRNDAFVSYAFATLSGKQSKPQAAIAYTKRAIELAPDFAWGYRTIAFLEEKWLNQPVGAKANYSKAFTIEPKLSEAAAALIALCLANNQYDEAIDIAQEAIARNPRRSANYLQLANIYIQQWRLNEAAHELKKAITIDTQNTRYYRQLAFILHKEGDLSQAISVQKKAVDYSNDKSADLVELAWLQVANDEQNEAWQSLKQAVDVNPENTTAISELTSLSIAMGKFDDLISELNKCAAKAPKNELIKLRLGDALAADKKIDKAIAVYKEAANLNTNDAEPHTKIAALLIARKDYEGAAKEYTHALNINSNSVANLVALGGCEALMDDYLKAEAAFVTALALHQLTVPADSTAPPTRADVIKGLAALLFKEGRYGDAASQFIAVIEIDKNATNSAMNKFVSAQAVALRDLNKESAKQLDIAYSNLSDSEKNHQKINYIDTLLRTKRTDEALALLTGTDAASDAQAKDPFYYICLSRAYLAKGDLDKAEEAAKQALVICEKDNSPHSDTYCQIAEVLFAKDDLASAEKNANSAIGVNSRAFRAYVLLGNIALKQKQYKLATEAANKALEINPYYIDAYLLLGQAQSGQGDLKAAVSTYNKAADLYPAFMPTHEALLAVLKKTGTKEEVTREETVIAGLKSKQN